MLVIIKHNKMLLEQRLNTGYFRDCHGIFIRKIFFYYCCPNKNI